MKPDELERAEAGMVANASTGADTTTTSGTPATAIATGVTNSKIPQTHLGFTAHPGGRHPSRTSESTLTSGATHTREKPKSKSEGPGSGDNAMMHLGAQDGGGVTAPGTHESGLRNFALFRNMVRHH
jgi:hypothetical protein